MKTTCALLILSMGITCCAGVSSVLAQSPEPVVEMPSKLTSELADEYALDPTFFKKSLLSEGVLIVTSDRVSDEAIREAAYQFSMIMSSIQKDVARRIREKRVLCILLGHQELTSDVPQFKTDKTGRDLDFYNWRQRGFLTRLKGRPTVVFAEEDVLEYEGGMQLESILVHEFGHVIHNAGFDDALQRRLTDAFQRARAKGIWMDGRAAQRFRRVKSEIPVRLLDALEKAFPDQRPSLLRKCLERGDILVNGEQANADVRVTVQDKVLIFFGGEKECYAHKNRAEYWAEGVQCWYNTNRTMDHDHNHIHTREQLKAYDPALAALCKDVLLDTPWRFVSPRKRAGKDHLAAFDPKQSPVVNDPPHIENAAYDYYDKYWESYWQRLAQKHSLARELSEQGIESLAAASQRGNPVRGAIIFSQQELGCVACHGPADRDLLGPDLSLLGAEMSTAHLVESLLHPSKKIQPAYQTVKLLLEDGTAVSGRVIREGNGELVIRETDGERRLRTFDDDSIVRRAKVEQSAMPANLVDRLETRQEFLDLIRYLEELKATGKPDGHGASEGRGKSAELSPLIRGLALIDSHQCRACHALGAGRLREEQAGLLGPRLDVSSGRISPAYVQRFIRDPHATKPGTMMPNMLYTLRSQNGDQPSTEDVTTIAREISVYLSSLSRQKFKREPIKAEAMERGEQLYHSVGCVACHAPADGSAELQAASSPLGPVGEKYSLAGLIAFLKEPHVARPSGRMPSLQLSHWEATDIASYLLGRDDTYQQALSDPNAQGNAQGNAQDNAQDNTQDNTQAEDPADAVLRGRRHFATLRCVACHATGEPTVLPRHADLAAKNARGGCLSGESGPWPDYKLSAEQRTLISNAIQQFAALRSMEPESRIQRTLATMNCLACHRRNEVGGVSADRDAFFQSEDLNLGPQGRLPPTLSNVGAKLKPNWLRQVLVQGGGSRSYVKTRMPQFGAANVEHLVELFAIADKSMSSSSPQWPDEREAKKKGHELAGRAGLNCIACHSFQQKRGASMSAVDLTEMSGRLQKGWFEAYMQNPQSLSPRTVMPSFWPGGKAIRPEILEGNRELQVDALWRYLEDGRQARAPDGLIRKPLRLVAGEEAVMLRRSYPNIGKRGIGVGYPRQVNLAFDAEQMRLALLWNGEFADPSGVFRSQGHGMVRPLSRNVLSFPNGPDVDDQQEPWVPDDGRPPKHQFRGYELDALRRPKFKYRFESIDVVDYSQDVVGPSPVEPVLRRTIALVSPEARPGIRIRLAADASIKEMPPQQWNVGDRLLVKVVQGAPASIRKSGDLRQLEMNLDLPSGRTEVVIEYRLKP